QRDEIHESGDRAAGVVAVAVVEANCRAGVGLSRRVGPACHRAKYPKRNRYRKHSTPPTARGQMAKRFAVGFCRKLRHRFSELYTPLTPRNWQGSRVDSRVSVRSLWSKCLRRQENLSVEKNHRKRPEKAGKGRKTLDTMSRVLSLPPRPRSERRGVVRSDWEPVNGRDDDTATGEPGVRGIWKTAKT